MELDRPCSNEANTTHNKTGAHIELSGQKGRAKKHLAQRSRNVKSRTQMERTGSPKPKAGKESLMAYAPPGSEKG